MWNLIVRFIRWNWNLDNGGMPSQPARSYQHKTITHAFQRGRYVVVCSGGSELFTHLGEYAGTGSDSVTIKSWDGHWTHVYNSRNQQIASAHHG